MKTPRKAVILAAGFGSRLRPLTDERPKCLLPVWNRPVVDRLLDMLADWGVVDVLINLHHGAGALFEHLRRRASGHPRLALSHEPDIRGTGGALVRGAWFLDAEPFWMLNGDIALDVDPATLRTCFRHHHPLAVLLMTPHSGPRTVELHADGRIRTFRSQTPGTPGTHTFCGIQLLSPRILRYLPPGGFATIVDAYERAMQDGERVLGVSVADSYWADLGTPEEILRAHADILDRHLEHDGGCRLMDPDGMATMRQLRRRGVRVSGFAAVDPTSCVESGAALHNAVVLGGAHLGSTVRAHAAVVGPDVVGRGSLTRLAVRADRVNDDGLAVVLDRLKWRAAATTVLPLPPRPGSKRTYTRLLHGTRRLLLVRYDPARPENARAAGHARFLRALGLPVPAVVLDDPARCLTVMADAGEHDLLSATRNAPTGELLRRYRTVIHHLARWHSLGGAAARRRRLALEPPFDAVRFAEEHALFRDAFLVGRLGLSRDAMAPVAPLLARLARRLLDEPRTLVHRDMQSTNVLLSRTGPIFIDFQGMRLGPAVYDVASLLADPYVMLPADLQERLLTAYARAAGLADTRALREAFWHAAAQRLVQAIGAYARLSRLPAQQHFATHILPALDMLDRAARRVYTDPVFQEFIATVKRREIERGNP